MWNVRASGCSDLFHYQLLTSKYLDSACKIIKHSLFIPASQALGFDHDREALAELDQLPRATAKDGVSVIAVDKNTNKVAAVAFNKIFHKTDLFLENFAETLKNPKSRQIFDLVITNDDAYTLFDHCQADCVMEIFLVGTSPEYRKQGIAKNVCKISVDIAQNLFDGVNVKQPIGEQELGLEPVPKAVTGICKTSIAERIARELGFQTALKSRNTKLEVFGKALKIPNAVAETITLEYKKLYKTYNSRL